MLPSDLDEDNCNDSDNGSKLNSDDSENASVTSKCLFTKKAL